MERTLEKQQEDFLLVIVSLWCGCPGRPGEARDPLELEAQVIVSHLVWVQGLPRVPRVPALLGTELLLCKNRKCSQQLFPAAESTVQSMQEVMLVTERWAKGLQAA